MNRAKRKIKIIVGDGAPIVTRHQNRNAKCGCGSGKKAKYCCGTQTQYFSTKPKEPETRNPKPETV